jgi:hypothetical protein
MRAGWILPLILLTVVFHADALRGQMLLVDRGAGSKSGAHGLGVAITSGYVGDHFLVGSAGELWLVESARVWVVPEPRIRREGKVGDFFGKIAFAGGIEIPPPAPGQPDCDCHNLLLLQTGVFARDKDESGPGDVQVTRISSSLWQIDFRRLHWSIPGGNDIQFGILASGRLSQEGNPYRLFSAAQESSTPHHLRIFTDQGKMQGPYTEPGLRPNTVIPVQIRGHLQATVSIRPAADTIDVVLHGSPSFDIRKTEASSLRFGPKKSPPVSTSAESSAGQSVMVARFRRQDAGIQPTDVNVCLSGRQNNGVLFEGCALLGHR